MCEKSMCFKIVYFSVVQLISYFTVYEILKIVNQTFALGLAAKSSSNRRSAILEVDSILRAEKYTEPVVGYASGEVISRMRVTALRTVLCTRPARPLPSRVKSNSTTGHPGS